MVRTVIKPNLLRGGHVWLFPKLVSESCKRLDFCYKLDPKHDTTNS